MLSAFLFAFASLALDVASDVAALRQRRAEGGDPETGVVVVAQLLLLAFDLALALAVFGGAQLVGLVAIGGAGALLAFALLFVAFAKLFERLLGGGFGLLAAATRLPAPALLFLAAFAAGGATIALSSAFLPDDEIPVGFGVALALLYAAGTTVEAIHEARKLARRG